LCIQFLLFGKNGDFVAYKNFTVVDPILDLLFQFGHELLFGEFEN